MTDKFLAIETTFLQEVESAKSTQQLQDVKVKYLGKSGEVTLLLRGIKDYPAEQRPEIGNKIHELRKKLEAVMEEKFV